MWRRTRSEERNQRALVAVFVTTVLVAAAVAVSPASASIDDQWDDAPCPKFYELFESADTSGVTVCQHAVFDTTFFVQNVGTTVWLITDGTPRLSWTKASRVQSIESKILQDASPAPASSVWIAPGDRFVFTQGYLESFVSARPAETLALHGLGVGLEQVKDSAIAAGVSITVKQLINNKTWRPALTTCVTSLISRLPDDDPSATPAAAKAYLTTVSTVFGTGMCAAQLAGAQENARLTVPLTWAPVAEDLAKLQKKTSFVEIFVEGIARFLRSAR